MGNFALVNVPIAKLMTLPTRQCELADEALHGYKVEILEERSDGWALVRTHYNYEGFARIEDLVCGGEAMVRWEALPKKTVLKAQADVLGAPKVQGWQVASLPRGAVVAVLSEEDASGWARVALADGREGYTKAGYLDDLVTSWLPQDEAALRQNFMGTALLYLGTQYRWGGKTPQGIDCSGLCSMAYMHNGVIIYRDADIREGFCMRKIPVEQAGEGDLIFFEGHVAMHLGDGKIIHSTARNGSDGVVFNSLNPAHRDYRPDLIPLIRFAGTIF